MMQIKARTIHDTCNTYISEKTVITHMKKGGVENEKKSYRGVLNSEKTSLCPNFTQKSCMLSKYFKFKSVDFFITNYFLCCIFVCVCFLLNTDTTTTIVAARSMEPNCCTDPGLLLLLTGFYCFFVCICLLHLCLLVLFGLMWFGLLWFAFLVCLTLSDFDWL